MIERFCFESCEERRQDPNRKTVDMIIMSIKNCKINGIACPLDPVCQEKKRDIFQCKCRDSRAVTIWVIHVKSFWISFYFDSSLPYPSAEDFSSLSNSWSTSCTKSESIPTILTQFSTALATRNLLESWSKICSVNDINKLKTIERSIFHFLHTIYS